MAKIKRGGKGVRRAAKATGRANTARRAKAKTTGAFDSVMGLLPFTEEQLQRLFLAMIIGGGVALAWFIATLAGVPAMARAEVSRLASDAGFEVRHVRVTGTERMNKQLVYAEALSQHDRPMPNVQLNELRADLLDLPWVKDARVSVQLPETLAIDIVERTPHAVLQKPDRLVLIDATGIELEPVSTEGAKGFLMISGPGASRQVAELDELLASAPALNPQIVAAEWVGNRRWNLTFKTEQILALPEGKRGSANALVKFARLDGQNRLIGGKVATFDMRAPPRIYLRVPGRADEVLGDANGENR